MRKSALPMLAVLVFSGAAAPPARAQTTIPGMQSTEVAVRHPGVEPRSTLMYQPTTGATQSLLFAVATQQGRAEFPGIPTVQPEFHFELESHAEPRQMPLGGFRVVNQVTKAFPRAKGKLSAKVWRTMVTQIASMQGSQVTLYSDSQGRGDGFGFQPSASADKDFSQALPESLLQLRSLVVPLPTIPVGVGATWDAKLTLPTNGVAVLYVAHYTLKSLANGIATVEGTLEGQPELATFPSPFPETPKLVLKSVQLTGTMSATLDLAKGMPSEAQVKLHTLAHGLPAFADSTALVSHDGLVVLTLRTRTTPLLALAPPDKSN